MVFSSIVFLLFFLPVFLLAEAVAGGVGRIGNPAGGRVWMRNIVTLAFSIFFYAWGAPELVFVVLGTTLLDFYLVRIMHASSQPRTRALLLGLTVVVNIGLLFYFKYSNFFLENLSALIQSFGAGGLNWALIVLPIGISFFTFQKVTYAVDVYRKVHEPLKNPLDHLLYILMFPQLIAGPIVRFHTIADQLVSRRATEDDRLTGFFRFCIGLAKKVLIANVIGAQADEIFKLHPAELDSTLAWVGILAYTFQIYFDFAGYSDMAIGIGRMIGFRFPENFNNPYTSGSITEFWRRWHITLGAWMRDYLYIPLGGNRVKTKGRLYWNLWVVFLLSGLWHGASWNFVLWGAWHGLFLVLDRIFLAKLLDKVPRLLRVAFTFFVVVMGWVLFRVDGLAEAGHYYARLFAFDFGYFGVATHLEFFVVMGLAVFFSFFTLLKIGQKAETAIYRETYRLPAMTAVLLTSFALFILCLASITTFSFNPFIYFRF
jgi:alginate O-acetyltransferase complex protein AlgI